MTADKREKKPKTFAEALKEQEDFQNRMTWREGDLVLLKSDPREKPPRPETSRRR
jgi:hypothetical protein